MDPFGYIMQELSEPIASIGARLRQERERLALTMQQMADAVASRGVVGGTRQSQRKYESGERHPDAPYLAVLQDLGVDVTYVLSGRRPEPADLALQAKDAASPLWRAQVQIRPVAVDTTQSGGRPRGTLPEAAVLPATAAAAARPLVLSLPVGGRGGPNIEVEYHVIPRHMRAAAAGAPRTGEEHTTDELDRVGQMAFTADWIRHNLGHAQGMLSSVRVRGDSMATTLLDGDTIIIDEGVGRVDVDGIYVLDVYGRRLVKRVQALFDGTLILISDNPAYERQTIPRSAALDVRVVGRMVWPRGR